MKVGWKGVRSHTSPPRKGSNCAIPAKALIAHLRLPAREFARGREMGVLSEPSCIRGNRIGNLGQVVRQSRVWCLPTMRRTARPKPDWHVCDPPRVVCGEIEGKAEWSWCDCASALAARTRWVGTWWEGGRGARWSSQGQPPVWWERCRSRVNDLRRVGREGRQATKSWKTATSLEGAKPACGYVRSKDCTTTRIGTSVVGSCPSFERGTRDKKWKASRARNVKSQALEPFWTRHLADLGWLGGSRPESRRGDHRAQTVGRARGTWTGDCKTVRGSPKPRGNPWR